MHEERLVMSYVEWYVVRIGLMIEIDKGFIMNYSV